MNAADRVRPEDIMGPDVEYRAPVQVTRSPRVAESRVSRPAAEPTCSHCEERRQRRKQECERSARWARWGEFIEAWASAYGTKAVTVTELYNLVQRGDLLPQGDVRRRGRTRACNQARDLAPPSPRPGDRRLPPAKPEGQRRSSRCDSSPGTDQKEGLRAGR